MRLNNFKPQPVSGVLSRNILARTVFAITDDMRLTLVSRRLARRLPPTKSIPTVTAAMNFGMSAGSF